MTDYYDIGDSIESFTIEKRMNFNPTDIKIILYYMFNNDNVTNNIYIIRNIRKDTIHRIQSKLTDIIKSFYILIENIDLKSPIFLFSTNQKYRDTNEYYLSILKENHNNLDELIKYSKNNLYDIFIQIINKYLIIIDLTEIKSKGVIKYFETMWSDLISKDPIDKFITLEHMFNLITQRITEFFIESSYKLFNENTTPNTIDKIFNFFIKINPNFK
jgi:hypothetical protein